MLLRNLGQSGISVSAIGLGCMGLSEFCGEPMQESEAINLLHRAVDLGITHFDTAEIYGQGRNEQLLGRAFAGRWHQIVLATKLAPNGIRLRGPSRKWTVLQPMSGFLARRVFSVYSGRGTSLPLCYMGESFLSPF